MSDTLLMVADSERDANMLYATGLFVPDPFIYLNFGRRPLIVLSDLEIDRARRQAPHCRAVPLTSEKLRSVIDCAILQARGLAANTIVAGGRQGCDPHERGFGRLRANEPVVIDIFPRSQKTGYFGDITRTVVRGRASEAVKKLYDTGLRGQKIGFENIHAGASGAEVHKAVKEFFDGEGYKTGRRNGRMQGFFHGT